ncbi:hypothetical protein EB796_011646 [Bugula neritina]|uniref:M6PR n=1 Tax=Bugula neritina TaxID=10212 RepID=A0A7J7JUJ8_BUGNE|nr:hypothetical protein EB796_011646 [Bugula neritina]
MISLDIDGLAPVLKDKDGKDEYFFSPCRPLKGIKELDNECESSAACQKDGEGKLYKLGSDELTFEGTSFSDLQFVYGAQSSTDKLYRKSVLKLECAVPDLVPALNFVEQTGNASGDSESTPLVYEFLYTGDAACVRDLTTKKISGGSVLLIIFFVGLFLYLVIGILVNKCVRGAVGLEVIPNYAFWQDLPSLTKEGFAFTIKCGCCKGDETARGYDNI